MTRLESVLEISIKQASMAGRVANKAKAEGAII
jgi:hypothetical protein